MTDNCRVYSNLKTFEYDLAIECHSNAKIMLEIILQSIQTDGNIADKAQKYIDEIVKLAVSCNLSKQEIIEMVNFSLEEQ